MTAKDRYNNIIETIEELILQCRVTPLDNSELSNVLCNREGLDIRQLNTLFLFFTNSTLIDYIKERRLMSIYEDILEDVYDTEVAIYKAGYASDSALSKAFKNRFGCTITDVKNKKIKSMYEPPLFWDNLGKENIQTEDINSDPNIDSKFGIKRAAYQRYVKAANLQEYYNMEDDMAEIAFQMSEKCNVSMEKSFECLDSILKSEFFEKTIDIFLVAELLFCAIKFPEVSIQDIRQLLNELHMCHINLFSENMDIFDAYCHGCSDCWEYIRFRECFKKVMDKCETKTEAMLKFCCGDCDYYIEKTGIEYDYSFLDNPDY